MPRIEPHAIGPNDCLRIGDLDVTVTTVDGDVVYATASLAGIYFTAVLVRVLYEEDGRQTAIRDENRVFEEFCQWDAGDGPYETVEVQVINAGLLRYSPEPNQWVMWLVPHCQ